MQSGNYEYQFNPITVLYLGTEVSTSWDIVIDVPDDATLSACWAVQCKLEDGILTLRSNYQNAKVNPNETVTNFGFQISTSMSNYELNVQDVNFYTATNPNPNEVVITEGITVTYTESNRWKSNGMYVSQGTVKILNETGYDLTYWQVNLSRFSDVSLTGIWNGIYVEKEEMYILTASENTEGILSGQSREVGVQFESASSDIEIEILSMFGKAIVID